MKQLIDLCQFLEFGDPPPAPSIRDYISTEPQPDEDKIANYLGNGIGISGRSGYLRDVIDPSFVGLTSATLTDGVYVWSSCLVYYVKKYHLRIPAAVIDHMRSNSWTVPDEDSVELEEP